MSWGLCPVTPRRLTTGMAAGPSPARLVVVILVWGRGGTDSTLTERLGNEWPFTVLFCSRWFYVLHILKGEMNSHIGAT